MQPNPPVTKNNFANCSTHPILKWPLWQTKCPGNPEHLKIISYIGCILNPPQADAYVEVEEDEEEKEEEGARPEQEEEQNFLRGNLSLTHFEQVFTCRPLPVESRRFGRLAFAPFAAAKMWVLVGNSGRVRRLWTSWTSWWGSWWTSWWGWEMEKEAGT